MNVKTEICNLAQGRLGSYTNIQDIDDPKTASERIFARWFELDRAHVLKVLAPNFALARSLVSKSVTVPVFGPAYAYEKPIDCLRVLGIGEIQEKENNYSVEGEFIITDEDYPDGMPIRYVKDVTDIAKFTPEAISLLSWQLAYDTCIEITKDYDKLQYIEKIMPSKLSNASSLSGLENRPTRINNSKFKQSRYTFNPANDDKR